MYCTIVNGISMSVAPPHRAIYKFYKLRIGIYKLIARQFADNFDDINNFIHNYLSWAFQIKKLNVNLK